MHRYVAFITMNTRLKEFIILKFSRDLEVLELTRI